MIKKMGPAHSFKFATTLLNQSYNYFAGLFLDVQTLGEVLLKDEGAHLSLERTGRFLTYPYGKKQWKSTAKLPRSISTITYGM